MNTFEEWEAERLRDPEFLAALAARYPEHERARAQVQLNIMRAALKTALDALEAAPSAGTVPIKDTMTLAGFFSQYQRWYRDERQAALRLAEVTGVQLPLIT